MVLTGEHRNNWQKKTCHSVTLSTTNVTWTALGSNSGLRGDRPYIKLGKQRSVSQHVQLIHQYQYTISGTASFYKNEYGLKNQGSLYGPCTAFQALRSSGSQNGGRKDSHTVTARHAPPTSARLLLLSYTTTITTTTTTSTTTTTTTTINNNNNNNNVLVTNLLHTYNGNRVSFPEVKRPGCGVNYPPHLASRLKKEYSYGSTLHLDLRGLLLGETYLLLLLLLLLSSSSPLCRVFILIFLRQTMSLGNTVLQLICCYYS